MTEVQIVVRGIPGPQGSKSVKGRRRNGSVILVESSRKVKPWRASVVAAAIPAAYVGALIDCTREWMRVLKPEGNLFINLGNKYSTYEGPRNVPQNNAAGLRQGMASQEGKRYTKSAPSVYGVPYKSLSGLPWRYALRCLDHLEASRG